VLASPRQKPHGTLSTPYLESVSLFVRVMVRRGRDFEHRFAGWDDQRVGTVERLFELEIPFGSTLV
jgi:hypothetical protein